MLASRHGTANNVTKNAYVCLGCRLKTQQKRRYGDQRREIEKHEKKTDNGQNATLRYGSLPNTGDSRKSSTEARYGESVTLKEALPAPSCDDTVSRPDHVKPRSSRRRRASRNIIQGDAETMGTGLRIIKKIPPRDRARILYQFTGAPITPRPVSSNDKDRRLEGNVDQHLEAVERQDAARMAQSNATKGHSSAAHRGEPASNLLSRRLVSSTEATSLNPLGGPASRISRKNFSYGSAAIFGQSAARQGLVSPVLEHGRIEPSHVQARLYHSSLRSKQESAASTIYDPASESSAIGAPPTFAIAGKPNGIRAQLRQWQELHGDKDPMPDIPLNDDVTAGDEPVNNLTRLPEGKTISSQISPEEDEKENFDHWSTVGKEGFDGTREDSRYLRMGDLVEVEFLSSERESVLAVYVQPVKTTSFEGQFFTMQGRWMHLPEKAVQYSIPDWVSPELVKPLIAHLPNLDEARDLKGLLSRAYLEDLSVPRDVAAPLVKRMVEFYSDSQDIYRRHASTLDNAHEILSHDTDLRYGSLTSAATTLLQTPSNQLPLTALFTVRKALSNAGFAFNIDRRSHRLTGYLQIRSKEQVRMVENVRNWIRQWQDDLAAASAMDEKQLEKRKMAKGARVMYGFLDKAKAIVSKNRENRQPTKSFNVGPSKKRLPITPDSDSVKVHLEVRFSQDEEEVVRFIESWSCSQMFIGLPRIESLPPLILQALGYEKLDMATGFLFLQELGTIMPYENRVRFDQHLLLPSSQHSKPLQNLMTSLLSMRDTHNFVDSMAGLRHDWKDLPVFCIDSADAHEIDDGVSIEPAGVGPDGGDLHWVHIHIANPTAFFARDHPLAKMARHMGESIYMPERTYMMLPRWATQKYFSLASGRPCMTFSAKMDANGNTLENKITPGIIRNVITLTPDEVHQVVGGEVDDRWPEATYTVGGNPPQATNRKNKGPRASLGSENVEQLKILRLLSEQRAKVRKQAGGVFFDYHRPEIAVWQSHRRTGLSWDHPFRKGRRTVEGDPIIQFKTRGLVHWFAPSTSIGHNVVQELMLLAGEIAASWCAARQIPIIYRGTVRNEQKGNAEDFWEQKIAPHVNNGGIMPMHLGVEYIQRIGSMVLRTTPKQHSFLGLRSYAKVTSPLRRYGDMIHHWQIEAALRHEADTGRSLIALEGSKPDRSFLPFSAPVLDTIMLGLQPRETIITRAKGTAEAFWIAMLLFRKTVFGEDGHLPFLPDTHYKSDLAAPLSLVGPPKASAGTAANDLRPLRVYVSSSDESGDSRVTRMGILLELNIFVSMQQPSNLGLEEAHRGDVWECFIQDVDVYKRSIFVKPVRLIGREGAGLL